MCLPGPFSNTTWSGISTFWGPLAAMAIVLCSVPATPAQDRRPSSSRHVPELAAYLDQVQISEPIRYGRLAVYPVLLQDGVDLRGRWLTLDAAVSRGVLEISEKGAGGSVPAVIVENRSRREYVFMMQGEVLSGGKQSRTVRRDVALAPGQRIELEVLCVEKHRWEGKAALGSAGSLVPQSIQQELRRGADQQRVWSEVARKNKALGAENPTASLERALRSRPVQDKLAEVRGRILPQIPRGTTGFIFVDGRRALGADLFGDASLARDLLPKLLDSYAVDCVVIASPRRARQERLDDEAAIEFFKRVVRAGSARSTTPGSGAGIETRAGGLLGEGVSHESVVVHFGVQVRERVIPHPKPLPIYPRPEPR